MKSPIAIHGGRGTHATDILERGIFDGLTLQIVDKGDVLTQPVDGHMVFLPIISTKQHIKGLLRNPDSQAIVNFSGIQATTPIEAIAQKTVTNIHFLFGPKMEGALKASLCLGRKDTVIEELLANIQRAGIHIIEHSTCEHDKKVAITQGLAHGLFLALSQINVLPKALFERWALVPAHTSGDMIYANPFVKKVIYDFISLLKRSRSVKVSLSEIVEGGEIQDFTTPNFERIFKGLLEVNGPETNIEASMINSKIDKLIFHLETIASLGHDKIVELIVATRRGNQDN